MRVKSYLPLYVVILAIIGVTLVITFLKVNNLEIVKNISVSAPTGLYLLEKGKNIEKKDWVSFYPLGKLYKYSFIKKEPLLKKVKGVKGDMVCRKGSRIILNGEKLVKLKLFDFRGNKLPRLLKGCVEIPENKILAISTFSSNSFDSRYFGLVRKEKVLGVLKPLITIR